MVRRRAAHRLHNVGEHLVECTAGLQPLELWSQQGGALGEVAAAPIGMLARRLGYEAVLPDLPGYGLTRVPRRRFTYPTWVACARDLAVAERERADRPVMALGASMGGMLAWHAAAAGAPLAGIVATTLIDPRDPEVLAFGERCVDQVVYAILNE